MAHHGRPIAVGIAGLGRSGWGIHARALADMADDYRIVAVTDPSASRRDEAVTRYGCRAHANFESLIADAGVEVVVVATPNTLHVEHAIAAAEAGRHVVCEKPVADSTRRVEQLLATAESTRRLIAPFHNCRFDAMYQKISEVIASGTLGRIVEIRACEQRFDRRWDWQTLREFGGGILNVIGSHVLDQLLIFLGDTEPQVHCRMDRALWSGDAEDHVKVILHAKNAPLIELELSSVCAYPQPKWLVLGTRGGLRSENDTLHWRHVDFSSLPERPVDRHPVAGRTYNSEQLPWQEMTWRVPQGADNFQTHRLFYEDLGRAIREGASLTVTLQHAARQIAVIEKCHATSGFGEV